MSTIAIPYAAFRRQAGARPLILGHRGARAHAPENTQEAFLRALSDGADGVELDVRMSRDGELFISHDDRVVMEGHDQPPRLGQLDAERIHRLGIDQGRPLMTLQQVLRLQKDTGALFNIELKSDLQRPLEMTRRVVEQVRNHGGDGILLSSFSPYQVGLLRLLVPTIPVCQLLESNHWLSARLRLLPLLGVAGVNLQADLLTAGTMKAIRSRFPLINTWTVNSATQAKRMAELGVDAIITDDPALILAALK